jgi:DNA-binding NtrC family response regulator
MNRAIRVLIVEDSENDTELILRELKQGGYDPIHKRVDTAAAMIEALDAQPWDAIVSDHAMPQFNALDAHKLMKDKGVNLPFIIVTGVKGEVLPVKAIKAGIEHFIPKNKLSLLVPTLDEELRKTRMARVQSGATKSGLRFRDAK